MSKELEALQRLFFNRNSFEYCDTFTDKHIENGAEIDFNIIRNALTPPTADEVCEALSEYIQWDVIYIKHNKEFMMKIDNTSIDNTSIVKVNMFGSVKFNAPLNARLITLIGRFYENEVKEK